MNDTSQIPAARFGSGRDVQRLEDDELLRGRGQFTDDVSLPGQCHLVFVRSPHAHAELKAIDTAAAKAMPGVLAVLTAQDLQAAGVKPLAMGGGFARPDGTPMRSAERHALALGRARFVGEAVAAVVASTPDAARAAAAALRIDYDELPAVVNVHDAMAPGAPLLFDGQPDNLAAERRVGDAAAAAQAFATAAHVVELEVDNQRVHALAIEPRSVLAWIDEADGRLTLRASSQMPSGLRDTVAACLGLAAEQVRVRVGDVGGGFGMKTGAFPEDVVVAHAAHSLKRPVKWTAERSEEFLAAGHGRDQFFRAALAFDAQGRIQAMRVHAIGNAGAYAQGPAVPIALFIGPFVQTSVYHVPLLDACFQGVYTHTTPVGAYRGAGRPEAVHLMERLMDEAARRIGPALGLDRTELRRRNFVPPSAMPYTNATGLVYDSGRFEHVMDQGLAFADWQGFAAREAQSKARGRWRGLGLATFLEWTSGLVFQERITLAVKGDGVIEVFTALQAMGQGLATSLAQLVVDAYGVELDRVRIVMGDTDRGSGFGSAGSRSAFMGGSAVKEGAERNLEQARTLAAEALEAPAADLDYAQGRFSVKGTDLGIDLFALAARQADRQIFTESTTGVSGPSWPNACHVCEVEVDPLTGQVDVVRYHSVNDVGRVINPMIVRGQLDGGVLQGLGQALTEHHVYDRATGQLLSGSLMDYGAPRAEIIGPMAHELDQSTPCLNNPMGIKGVGELGTIGATPAAVNAVADALARNGHAHKTAALQMPLSPGRLWDVLQA